MSRLPMSMRHRIWGRYRWIRGHRHIISPYDDKLRALAMPDTCSYFPVGIAPPPAERPPGWVGKWPTACPRCGHRHAGLPCASHLWDDPCGLDAGADCPNRFPHRPVRDYLPVRLLRSSPAQVAEYLSVRRSAIERLASGLDVPMELLDVDYPGAYAAVSEQSTEPVEGAFRLSPYPGPRLPEHVCPGCGVERADYEGPGRYLPTCPNCGATETPIEAS